MFMFTDWNYWKYHFFNKNCTFFRIFDIYTYYSTCFPSQSSIFSRFEKKFQGVVGIFRERTNEGCKEDGNKDIINECILITSFLVRKLFEYSMFIYPGTLKKHRKRIHHEERARAQLLRRHSLPVQPLFEQPDSYNPRNQRYPNVGFMHKWNVLLRVN